MVMALSTCSGALVIFRVCVCVCVCVHVPPLQRHPGEIPIEGGWQQGIL